MKSKLKFTKKKLIVAVVCLVLIVSGATAFLLINTHKKSQQEQAAKKTLHTVKAVSAPVPSEKEADRVFYNYLVKTASSKSYYSLDSQSSVIGGEKFMKGKTAINTDKKSWMMLAELNCYTVLDNAPITANASVQIENGTTFIRLNYISGTVLDQDGSAVSLSMAYQNAKGIWYKDPTVDPAMQEQINNSIYVFDSGVIAPFYDAKKVADSLLKSGAFTYSLNELVGKKYIFSVSVDREKYLSAIHQTFPNLKNQEQIIRLAFGEASTMDSTITTSKDGTLLGQESMQPNLCQTVLQGYVSTGVNVSSIANSTSTVKPSGITLFHILNSRNIE